MIWREKGTDKRREKREGSGYKYTYTRIENRVSSIESESRKRENETKRIEAAPRVGATGIKLCDAMRWDWDIYVSR